MTERDPAVEERLRRLAERRAASRAASPTPTSDTILRTARDASIVVRPNRRKHAAAAGRVVAAGASASAFMMIVTGLAANPPAWSSAAKPVATSAPPGPIATFAVPATKAIPSTTATPTTTQVRVPPTIVVVQQVHHREYVDQFGNPIDPNALPPGVTVPPAPVYESPAPAPVPAAPGPGSGAPSPSPSPAPTPAPTPTTVYVPPTTLPTVPPCTGSKCP